MGIFKKKEQTNSYDDLFRALRDVVLEHYEQKDYPYEQFEEEGNNLLNLLTQTSFDEESKNKAKNTITQMMLVKKADHLAKLFSERIILVVSSPTKENVGECYSIYLQAKETISQITVIDDLTKQRMLVTYEAALAPYKALFPVTEENREIINNTKNNYKDESFIDLLYIFDKKLDRLLANPTSELLTEITEMKKMLDQKTKELTIEIRNMVMQPLSTIQLYISSMNQQGNMFAMFLTTYVPMIKSEIAKIKNLVE